MFKPVWRENTWDENIWKSIVEHNEYQIQQNWYGSVIDVGAHIGSFSYFILSRGASRVVSVEPDQCNFHVLCQNMRLFIEAGRVIPINAGIGKPGTFLDTDMSGMENTGGRVYTSRPTGAIPAISLDALIDLLPQPIMLKIDCEGCEFEAFANSQKLNDITSIVGEVHTTNDTSITAFKELLTSRGFLYSCSDRTLDDKTGNGLWLFGAHQPDKIDQAVS